MNNNPANNYETEYIAKTLNAERCCLTLGWLNPTNLNDAGCKIKLSSDHFHSDVHGFIYYYICWCTEQKETPEVEDCCKRANELNVHIDIDDLFNLINQTDVIDGSIDLYVGGVLDAFNRRENAKQHHKQFRHVIREYAGV